MDANDRGRADRWVSARTLAQQQQQQAHAHVSAPRSGGGGHVMPPPPRSGGNMHVKSGSELSRPAQPSSATGSNLHRSPADHWPSSPRPAQYQQPQQTSHRSGSRRPVSSHHVENGDVTPPRPRSMQMAAATAPGKSISASSHPNSNASANNTPGSRPAAHPSYGIPTPRHGPIRSPEHASAGAPNTSPNLSASHWGQLCSLPAPASSGSARHGNGSPTSGAATAAAVATTSANAGTGAVPSGSLMGSFSASGTSPFPKPSIPSFATSPLPTAVRAPSAPAATRGGGVVTSPFLEGLGPGVMGSGKNGIGGGSFSSGGDISSMPRQPFSAMGSEAAISALPPSQPQSQPQQQLPQGLATMMHQMRTATSTAGDTGASTGGCMATRDVPLSAFPQNQNTSAQQSQQSVDVVAMLTQSLEHNSGRVPMGDGDGGDGDHHAQASLRALVEFLSGVGTESPIPNPSGASQPHAGLVGDNIFGAASQPFHLAANDLFPSFTMGDNATGGGGGVPFPHSSPLQHQQQHHEMMLDHFANFSRAFGTGLSNSNSNTMAAPQPELFTNPVAADLFSQLTGGGGDDDHAGVADNRGSGAGGVGGTGGFAALMTSRSLSSDAVVPQLHTPSMGADAISGHIGGPAPDSFSGTLLGADSAIPTPAATGAVAANTAPARSPPIQGTLQPVGTNLRDLFSKLTQPSAAPPSLHIAPEVATATAATLAAGDRSGSRAWHEDVNEDSFPRPSRLQVSDNHLPTATTTSTRARVVAPGAADRPASMAQVIMGGSGRGNSSASPSGAWRQVTLGATSPSSSGGVAAAANATSGGGSFGAAPATPMRDFSVSVNTPTLSGTGSTSRRGGEGGAANEERSPMIPAPASATLNSPLNGGSYSGWAAGKTSQVNSPPGNSATARAHRASLEAPTVSRASLACVFRETPPSVRHREMALANRASPTSLAKSPNWPPHTEPEVEKLLKNQNANKLLRHLTIVSYSRQNVKGVQELFDAWARNGIPAPDMGFGAYYYYVKEKSDKLLCMKHNGRGATPGHGYGKCDFESRRPNSTCRYEHVCLFCRSKDHGWFEEGKCEGYQQLLTEVEQLGVVEEDVEIMLNAMEKTSAWSHK